MNESHTQQSKILKELESRKYSGCYLIYNRKSTDEPENQKNSIKYQKSENTRFAYRNQLSIPPITIEGFCTEGIIYEKHSAFKENTELVIRDDGTVQYKIDRPKFYQLIKLLNAGYFKGVIVLCWDRISRNKGDEAIIRKLMKAGIDFRFVLATYDKTSSGALHMDIDGMFAEHHSRVTSEKVSISIRNQRDKGICTYKAPVGYLNIGRMDLKPFDEVRAPIIKQLFEKYATGEWTLASLARWSQEQGFTLAPSRRKRTKEEMLKEEEDDGVFTHIDPISRPANFTAIHKILVNPFYTGKIRGNDGKLVKSNSHQPLISEELFQKVQIQLNSKKVSIHYTDKLHYPFRGMVRCHNCSRIYTPYLKKGHIYYGARCQKECSNNLKSITQSEIRKRIINTIEILCLTDKEIDEINGRGSAGITLLETNRVQKLEEIKRQKKKIREDLNYLRIHKLSLLKTRVYSPEELLKEEDTLNDSLIDLQIQEYNSDAPVHEAVSNFLKLSELLNNLTPYYASSNSYELEDLSRTMFSELSLSSNALYYKCKNGFQALSNRFVPSGDPKDWISELPSRHQAISESIQDLEGFFKQAHGPPYT